MEFPVRGGLVRQSNVLFYPTPYNSLCRDSYQNRREIMFFLVILSL